MWPSPRNREPKLVDQSGPKPGQKKAAVAAHKRAQTALSAARNGRKAEPHKLRSGRRREIQYRFK
eukprot:15323936-Alexandrium_andersonii.AAC.1